MMKYFLFIMVLLVLNVTFWYVDGDARLTSYITSDTVTPTRTDPVLTDVFIYTLEEEVQRKVGQPIEGYEPSMFLEVFPGLVETDFEGVEASIGFYTIVQGRLVHELGTPELVHSAAGAITQRGMETLLHNVASRLEIDLQRDGTITDIMRALFATP
jgi:hypothetical protein